MTEPEQAGRMRSKAATYPGYRFPATVISHAVWLYHVFSLRLRDVELILAERGIISRARTSGPGARVRFGVRGQAAAAPAQAGRHLALG